MVDTDNKLTFCKKFTTCALCPSEGKEKAEIQSVTVYDLIFSRCDFTKSNIIIVTQLETAVTQFGRSITRQYLFIKTDLTDLIK